MRAYLCTVALVFALLIGVSATVIVREWRIKPRRDLLALCIAFAMQVGLFGWTVALLLWDLAFGWLR